MSIKSFKSFISEEAPASDYVAKKDPKDDKEDKALEPRVSGEQKFKDDHKIKSTKHPVAGDHQFDGSREEVKA